MGTNEKTLDNRTEARERIKVAKALIASNIKHLPAADIEKLQAELSEITYKWINCRKRQSAR